MSCCCFVWKYCKDIFNGVCHKKTIGHLAQEEKTRNTSGRPEGETISEAIKRMWEMEMEISRSQLDYHYQN